MLMSKRLGLAAALAVSVGLAGCAAGNDQAAAPPPAPAPTAAPAMPASPPPAAPMTAMQRNESLQTALNSNGAKLKVDGHMGPKTYAALRTFQRRHHLKPTGHPDAATLKALGLQG